MQLDENGKPKDAPTAARCLDLLGRYRNPGAQDKRDDGGTVQFIIHGLDGPDMINGEVVDDKTQNKVRGHADD